jgi:PleD family two-component response regulator
MEKNKKKILVVDDDERHLIATQEVLTNEGYDVFTYSWWLGVTNFAKKLQPDLVLLDINMPALSGTGLSSLLLSNTGTKSIPIVFYSSNDEDSLRKAVSEYGARGYICKGNIYELKRKVAYYLENNLQ